MATDREICSGPYVGLSLTSLALLISVSLNILLYSLRRKERQNRDVEEPLYRDYFHGNRFEDEEPVNQDNPIYGNICMDGGGPLRDAEYSGEPRTNQSVRQDEKEDSADVSYASLDLTVAQKRKKKRKYQQKQSQTHQVQTHSAPMAQSTQSCLDTGSDCEVALPSRSSSLMVSRNSIYLNSHQVALETEELERERERERISNRAREIEIRNMYGDFDHSLGQPELRHEEDD